MKKNQEELNEFTQEKESLVLIKNEVTRFETQISSYKKLNREKLEKFGLDIEDVIKTTFNLSSVEVKIEEKTNKINDLTATLKDKDTIDGDLILDEAARKRAYELSLFVQQSVLQEDIDKIKNDLSKPERDYQEYKEKLTKWEIQKKEIEGGDIIPNTLKFYIAEQKYLNEKLSEELTALRNNRLEKAMQIYDKKKEIIGLYNSFKKSIDTQITKDKEFNEKFKMEIEAGFRLAQDFSSKFLNFINKSKSGTFRGAEIKQICQVPIF